MLLVLNNKRSWNYANKKLQNERIVQSSPRSKLPPWHYIRAAQFLEDLAALISTKMQYLLSSVPRGPEAFLKKFYFRASTSTI